MFHNILIFKYPQKVEKNSKYSKDLKNLNLHNVEKIERNVEKSVCGEMGWKLEEYGEKVSQVLKILKMLKKWWKMLRKLTNSEIL